MSNEKENKSERKIVSFSVSPNLYNRFEDTWRQKGYPSRSNAIRDLLKSFVNEKVTDAMITALLTVTYDHDEADLEQILHIQHLHMDLVETLASFHLHLTESLCSDLITVRGPETLIASVEEKFRQVAGVHSIRRTIIHVET